MKFIRNTLFVLFILFVFPNHIFANEIVGPVTYVFEDPSDYDGYFKPGDSPNEDSINFIDMASVVALEDQEFLPNLIEEAVNDASFIEKITGNINLGFGELLPNFAVKNEVILDDLAPPSARMNVSTTDRFGSPFHATCVYQNLSPEECMQKYQPQVGNSDNPLLTSTPIQRILPRELWLEEKRKLAKSYKDGDSQNYKLKAGLSAKNVAQSILDIKNVEQLQNLSPESRQQIYALEPNKDVVPLVMYVKRHPNFNMGEEGSIFSSIANALWSFINNEDPYLTITAWIPSLKGLKPQTSLLAKTALPNELGAAVDDQQSTGYDWSNFKTVKDTYRHKIENTNKEITPSDPKFQFTGATINPKGDSGFSFPSTATEMNLQVPEEIPESLYVYEVSLIIPSEIESLFNNQSELAKAFFPQSLGNFPDSFVEIPLNKSGQNLAAEGKKKVTIQVPCSEDNPNVLCDQTTTTDETFITFSNRALEFSAVKDWITPYQLYGEKQAFRSINDPERFNTTCFFEEWDNKNINGGASLALSKNYSSILNTSDCPDSLQPMLSPEESTCSTPAPANEEACKLHNTSQLASFFTGNLRSPTPEMIAIIEQAADTHKVPSSLILGILYEEGGLNYSADSSGNGYNWEDLDLCAPVPNCNTYVSSTGASGPFKFLPGYWEDSAGDYCVFKDAAFAAASLLKMGHNGLVSAQYEHPIYGGTSCGGVDYYLADQGDSGGIPTNCSSDWNNDRAVYTAIRLYHGTCNDVERLQALDVFNRFR